MRKRQESRSFSCNNIAFRVRIRCPSVLYGERLRMHLRNADATARFAFAPTPQAAVGEEEAAAGENAEICAKPPPPFSANPPQPGVPIKRSTSESDLSAFDPVSALQTARRALVVGHFSPRSQSPIT